MTKEERTKVYEECKKYLVEIDKDPMTGPNCYDADTLTLGVMFRKLPGEVPKINPEVTNKVKNNGMYGVFRNAVLKVSSEEGWLNVVALDQGKRNKFLNQKDLRKIRYRSRMRQTGGLTLDNYQKVVNELVSLWGQFLNRENKKVKK